MKKIGLLSDTHGYLHPKVFEFFSGCDEVWHAGDIGNIETAHQLAEFRVLRAVHGNIDGSDVRSIHPGFLVFQAEDVKVVMMHIGGYPGRYVQEAKELIHREKPLLFISGHSHILKVIHDKKNHLLHINPGAAGKSGLHRVITLVRFTIEGSDIRDLEILEAQR
jgi:putative phosphoesterase